MTIEALSILLCRVAGLLFLIVGVSQLLPAIVWNERAGWTSYAPMPRGLGAKIWAMVYYYLPSVAQAFAGLALLLFSRYFGSLLCSGLLDR